MVFTSLALVCSFFVMRIYHHSADKPIPRWAEVVFVIGICSTVCQSIKSQSTQFYRRKIRKKTGPINRKAIVSSVDLADSVNEIGSSTKTETSSPNGHENHEMKWKLLAEGLDNLFFIIFLTLYICITVGLYVYIMKCRTGSKRCSVASF